MACRYPMLNARVLCTRVPVTQSCRAGSAGSSCGQGTRVSLDTVHCGLVRGVRSPSVFRNRDILHVRLRLSIVRIARGKAVVHAVGGAPRQCSRGSQAAGQERSAIHSHLPFSGGRRPGRRQTIRIVIPPSTGISTPVMKSFSASAASAAATSSGRPSRCSGMRFRVLFSTCSSVR